MPATQGPADVVPDRAKPKGIEQNVQLVPWTAARSKETHQIPSDWLLAESRSVHIHRMNQS